MQVLLTLLKRFIRRKKEFPVLTNYSQTQDTNPALSIAILSIRQPFGASLWRWARMLSLCHDFYYNLLMEWAISVILFQVDITKPYLLTLSPESLKRTGEFVICIQWGTFGDPYFLEKAERGTQRTSIATKLRRKGKHLRFAVHFLHIESSRLASLKVQYNVAIALP